MQYLYLKLYARCLKKRVVNCVYALTRYSRRKESNEILVFVLWFAVNHVQARQWFAFRETRNQGISSSFETKSSLSIL